MRKFTLPLLLLSSLLLVGCSISEKGGEGESGDWKVVTSINDLEDGDTVAIGQISKNVLVTSLTNNLLSVETVTFDETYSVIDSKGLLFTLGINGDTYTFENENGLLGSTATKKMAYDDGTTDWSISIDKSNNAIISNNYGKLLYNNSVPRITTYTSNPTSTMLYPQLFVNKSSTPVALKGISLNATSKDVSLNKTFQLSVTYNPRNASNKEVTWTSSKTNVATVSSTGLVTAKSVGSTVITATSKEGSYTASCTINVVEQAQDAWTIMIYMCGSDLESGSTTDDYGNFHANTNASKATGLASSDLDEILSVNGQPNDVNIIIETGGATIWQSGHSYSISNSQLERWHVENKKLVKDDSLTYASMGLTSTFQSFLEWGLNEYPAEKTGVILWNHGGGMRGVCYDEKSSSHNDNLINSEVNTAVTNAFKNTGTTKLEWIGYDACLMAVQDIAETNSKHFNYQVSAQESESGYGWDYDNWVDDLYAKKPTETILKAIVDSFIEDNGGKDLSTYTYGGETYDADQTLSYLNLAYAEDYFNAWEDLAVQLNNKLNSSNRKAFNSAITSKVKHFGIDDYDYFCTFDAKDFVDKLVSNSSFSSYRVDSSYTTAVLTALNNFVAYNVVQKGAGNANGVCMYWANNSEWSDVGTYYSAKETNFTNWRTLNETFGYHAS